jgi:hypothetical protein
MSVAWLASSDGDEGVACGWPLNGREVRGQRGDTSPAWHHAARGSGAGDVEAGHAPGEQI